MEAKGRPFMETDSLKLAKQYEKQKQWEKAVEYFGQYMNQHTDIAASVYASYAKCLRHHGATDQAQTILQKGYTLHPESEDILIAFFHLHEHTRNWKAALSIANTLIDLDPFKADHHFRQGKVHSYLNAKEKALESFKCGLIYRHGLSFERLIKTIQNGFTNNTDAVTTEYVFLGGKNNLGAFLHDDTKSEKYFTKISRKTFSDRREAIFYTHVYTHFPALEEIVPSYIDSQTFDKIQYLTIEMIDDAKQSQSLEALIDASQKISSVPHNDITKHYPNPEYSLSLKHKGYSIMLFFLQIHKVHHNERLFVSMKQYIKDKAFPDEVHRVLHQIEKSIMDNRLYLFIEPNKHYALLHGDFTPNNIKTDRNGSVKVFDWAGFKTGPRFMDVARYVAYGATGKVSYTDIKEKYLFNKQSGLTLIEQIFFLYAYVMMLMADLKNENMDTIISEYMYPAMTDMTQCVDRFKDEAFGPVIHKLSKEKETSELQYQKLQKELSTLKKEQKKIHSKLQNVLNSKSWTLTAPLRKVMEWRKRKR